MTALAHAIDVSLLFAGSAALVTRLRVCATSRIGAGGTTFLDWLAVYGIAGCVTAAAFAAGDALVVGLALAIVAAVCRPLFALVHPAGYRSMISAAMFRIALVAWLVSLPFTIGATIAQRVPLAVLAAAALVSMPVFLLDDFLLHEAAYRTGWARSDAPLPPGTHRPMVSVHVPCYAEPPDVVKATLDRLAELVYDDYEVIVIDNNTADEALWRPVEEHCQRLGPRFRFIHVASLPGAKAGALNLALTHTAPAAEVVAVVDADYQAEPDFLRDLVSLFGDERVGFVQTSHGYRDWNHSRYLTGCRLEYLAMYGGYMRSRDERGTALTTGTMCLVRRRALEKVGGWAKWCCTEDSELAIRMHAAGYRGRYIHRTYGRGLVPEEFAGYKRQRHRWIYGPTQEFRRHWRLYLPARWATPSALAPVQKVLLAHHGVRELVVAPASLLATAAVVVLVVELVLGFHHLKVSTGALVGLAAGMVAGSLALWPLLRFVVGCRPSQALRAILCRLALFPTRLSAGMAGWRSSRGAFLRTNKFPVSSSRYRALASVTGETVRGVAAVTVATVAVAAAGFFAHASLGALLTLAGFLFVRAGGWLAAPALALSAHRCLGHDQASDATVDQGHTAGKAE